MKRRVRSRAYKNVAFDDMFFSVDDVFSVCVFLFICVYIIKFLWGPDDEDDDYLCAKKHFARQGGSKIFHEALRKIGRVASLNFHTATLFVSPFLKQTRQIHLLRCRFV